MVERRARYKFSSSRQILFVTDAVFQSWMVAGGLWCDVIHGSDISGVFVYSDAINTATNDMGTIDFTLHRLN